MLKINKNGNALVVEGLDNNFYPNNGKLEIPFNSVILVTDESDMATFRSAANNDVLFSGLIEEIEISGVAMTKDTIINAFNAVSNVSTGGGGDVDLTDYYTKEETDILFQAVDEDKQDTLVSGENIKTINKQSLLGEGDIEVTQFYHTADLPQTLALNLYSFLFYPNQKKFAEIAATSTKSYTEAVEFLNKLRSGDCIHIDNRPMSSNPLIHTYTYQVVSKGDYVNNVSTPTMNIVFDVFNGVNKYPQTLILNINDEKISQLNSDFTKVPIQTTINEINESLETLDTAVAEKQDTLVSGTNIKTINNESILGEGNITIEGGGGSITTHTITLNSGKTLGAKYTGSLGSTIFVNLETSEYDINSINAGDIVTFNTGETGVVSITKDGDKFLYVNTKNVSTGSSENRMVTLLSNTSVRCYSMLNRSSYNSSVPTSLFGISSDQVNTWNNASNTNNYYKYLIGETNEPYRTVVNPPASFKGIYYRNTYDVLMNKTSMDVYSLFIIGVDYNSATEYTIGKGTGTGTLMQTPGYQSLTINADGSWTIPEVNDYEDGGVWYNSQIYVNGELVKYQYTIVGMTWNVGDKIRIVNENAFGQGLFQMWQDVNTSMNINVSYMGVDLTNASNQMMNAFNGNSYLIRSEANEWVGTADEFAAIATKDENIIYYVTE